MRWAAALAVWVGLLAGGAPAGAALTVGSSLNPDGSGFVWATNQGGAMLSWQACSGAGTTTCAPFGTGRSISTGNVASGTFFVVSSSDGQIGTSAVWQGNLTVGSPPGLSVGGPRANAVVIPRPGAWSGGWGAGVTSDLMQLSACANANGTDCTSLTPASTAAVIDYPYGCPGGGAVIDPIFTGWYLRIADQRLEWEGPVPVPVVLHVPPVSSTLSPYGSQLLPDGPTTASVVLGRIAPAIGPRGVGCGAPPLPADADPRHPRYHCPDGGPFDECRVARISAAGVAYLWCDYFQPCRPSVQLSRGSVVVLARRVPGSIYGPLVFRPPASFRRRLGPGPAIETVYDNGSRLARRRITIR